MKAIRRSAVLVAVLALVAFSIPTLASAASTQAVPTRHLPASGGTIKWPVMVHNATTCRWGSSPEVAGFDGTVKCKPGRVVRPATFQANTSTGAKKYTLNLVMRGTTRTVVHLEVVEAGKPTPTTTTTTTTTSTTTTTLPPASSPGWTSPNWSGYVWEGANDGLKGNWTVPTLDCADMGAMTGASSDWVGVNGAEYPELFQTGVTDECLNGVQTDWAWFTDEADEYSANQGSSNDVFDDVSPGDVINAEVYLDVNGYWLYEITDQTSGGTSWAEEPWSGSGLEAEWIEEDPGCTNSDDCVDNDGTEVWPFPDFGSVTFTNLSLTPTSGSWTLPYSDAFEMVAADGSLEALPSPIQGSGASTTFTVTYESPGELSSTAGSAAMKHPQSTFVAPVPRIVPQHQAGQLGSRSIPGPKAPGQDALF